MLPEKGEEKRNLVCREIGLLRNLVDQCESYCNRRKDQENCPRTFEPQETRCPPGLEPGMPAVTNSHRTDLLPAQIYLQNNKNCSLGSSHLHSVW